MDIQQGYISEEPHGVVHHYAEVSSDRDYKSGNTKVLPTLVEEEYNTEGFPIIKTELPTLITPVQQHQQESSSSMSSSIDMKQEDTDEEEDDIHLNPALLLNRYDKRKSSPAILGLPFGLNHEAQLSLHLSQQRNSIEAAMLLANFNRLMAFPSTTSSVKEDLKGSTQWQDDMSIPSQNKTSWDVLTTEQEANRRHSYDVNMSWQTMSESFLERPDLLLKKDEEEQQLQSKPIFKQEQHFYNQQNTPTKVSWSHDDLHHPHSQHPYQPYNNNNQHPHPTIEYTPNHHPNHPPPPPQNRMYHPNMSSPLAPHTYQQPSRYPPIAQQQPADHPMLHPLARSLPPQDPQQQQQYYSYQFPPPPLPPNQQQRYYYPTNGKLPLPSPMDPHHMQHFQQPIHHPPPIMAKPKRKKQKSVVTDDFEEEIVETNEADYPDMSTRDVEAARSDPEARPRKQKLRFSGDKYTPGWVRYNGQSKEGLCDTCKPGKWLQLKNSAYWYHKQFFHGISSVSGKEFVQPLETRWVDQDLVEGLCHQCHQWVAVSNVKRKNSVLWYRHAHKCHVYHKPKPNVPKKR